MTVLGAMFVFATGIFAGVLTLLARADRVDA